jgi:hypothetical protein
MSRTIETAEFYDIGRSGMPDDWDRPWIFAGLSIQKGRSANTTINRGAG